MLNKLKNFYSKNYKKLTIIPFIILIISLIFLINQYHSTGDIIKKDVTLTGGVSATIYTNKDIADLEEFLSKEFKTDFVVRKLSEFGTEKQLGIIIEASNVDADKLKSVLEEKLNLELTSENYSVEETGGSLGEAFYKQMIIAIIFAFIFMAIVVLITFRNLIPSLAVILSAFFDIVVTVTIVNIINLKISTAGIAAILLIMGYSLDTDILLTTRLIKRKEGLSIDQRIYSSIKTGLTMTMTTLIALLAGLIITSSPIIKQMFLIIIIGLIVDIFITYLVNANMIKMYLIKKGET